MNGEQIVGHVSWSPDFESRPENNIQKLLDTGALKLEPRYEREKLVSVDLVRGAPPSPDPQEDTLHAEVRPHQDEPLLTLIGSGMTSPEVEFTYTNWKGEIKQRKAVLTGLQWGSNEWHKEPQLLVDGYDLDKKAPRTYAVKDISDLRAL